MSEIQLLLCGTNVVDLEDWRANTTYAGGFAEDSPTVVWFWELMQAMHNDERAKLLAFVTGSPKVPATGFANLMGYGGGKQLFRLQRVQGLEAAPRLPTASTCFNTLNLSEFSSKEQLRAMLNTAMCEAAGFDEHAVAT